MGLEAFTSAAANFYMMRGLPVVDIFFGLDTVFNVVG